MNRLIRLTYSTAIDKLDRAIDLAKAVTETTKSISLTPVIDYNSLNITGNRSFDAKKRRPGVLALKRGMLTIFDASGAAQPATCLDISGCQALRTIEIDPVGAMNKLKSLKPRQPMHVLEVGIGKKSSRQLPLSRLKMFNECGVAPKRHVRGFPVHRDCMIEPGHHFRAAHFVPGQLVDVQAKT